MPSVDVPSQRPPHLDDAQTTSGAPPVATSRERTFDFSWDDPTGFTWRGTFTSRVPNIGQQIDIAKRVAQRGHSGGGSQVGSDVNDLIYTIAYLDTALVSRPAWAKDLEALPYVELVNGLAGEATAHLRSFRER